jgi:hypothetical protein
LAYVVPNETTPLELVSEPRHREIALKSDLTLPFAVVGEPEQDVGQDEVVGLLPIFVKIEDVGDEARIVIEEALLRSHEDAKHPKFRYCNSACPNGG